MADISKIKLLDGQTYNFKDEAARSNIRVYTSLSQLNLSGTPTMAQIYTAMVNGSIAIFDNGVIDQTALTIPDGSGNVASLVMFVKVGDYRGYALGGRAYNGVSVGAANFYYAAWDGTKFVGWNKMLPENGISLKTVTVSIPKNANHVTVSANVGSSETFLGWLSPIPMGWGAAIWYTGYTASNSIYTPDTATSARQVVCPYLVIA